MQHFDGTSFSDPPIFLAFSERGYPNHRRQDFLNQCGLRIENLVLVNQVHGTDVVVVGKSSKVSGGVQADALVTSVAGPILGVLTADCVPVFFWDKSKKVAGIAHAGWRGLKAGILHQVLQVFCKHFHSAYSAIQTLLGPAIRRCCYEVGEEFQSFFPSHYRRLDSGSGSMQIVTARASKGRVDLIGVACEQLLNEGVLAQNIRDSGICTSCQNQRFFSARRESTSERILSIIQIQP